MKDIALITGCYGQDGSYLAEQLSQEGYEVHGICREKLSENSKSIKSELSGEGIIIHEHYVSLYEYKEIRDLIGELCPTHIYHTAARHFSSEHGDNKNKLINKQLFDDNVLATSNLLCSCSEVSQSTRLLICGSCLMFDASDTEFQSEKTPSRSCSLYGIAKATEAELVDYYRSEGLFATVAILYNHESHRRSRSFVTKKIADGMKEIKEGKRSNLILGNIEIEKDWGFAGEYTKGMYRMLLQDEPDDYILSTGQLHSIREYIEECAKQLDIDNWEKYVLYDDGILTRSFHGQLCGINSKAKTRLNWVPEYGLKEIVSEMIGG